MEISPLLKDLASYFLGKDSLQENIVFRSNLRPNEAKRIGTDSYWKTVLIKWCKYNFHEPQNQALVKKQYLWFNSMLPHMIAKSKRVICIQKGFMTIEDLLTRDKFKTREQINSEYGIHLTCLEYNSLVSAVPSYWKFIINSNVELIDPHIMKWDFIEANSKPVRVIYQDMMSDDKAINNSAKKWNAMLQTEFEVETHSKAFKNIQVITNVTKYRDFQFRLLHNKIFCNNILYHWKKVNSQQ